MDVLRRSFLTLAAAALLALPAAAQTSITVASTTSTEQSGLFGHLLPAFKVATGIEVKVVALGTGQALDVARRGDADVVFVHDQAEAAGKDTLEALRRIAATKAPFVSRGDKSGTHAAELRYWQQAGLDLAAIRSDWYREIGQGMGPALNASSAANAYVLTDRATWLAFRNRGQLRILVEGDVRLFNQYGVILVDPKRHPHVKAAAGQRFVDWLASPAGQQSIAEYRIGGEQLFFPNAPR